jgi:hypothetical protein
LIHMDFFDAQVILGALVFEADFRGRRPRAWD